MQSKKNNIPVFDRAEQLRRLDGDEELIKEVVQAFLEDIPNKLVELNELLDKQDPQAISRHAHSIKGAAGNAGAAAMREIAFNLEQAGKKADWIQIKKLSSELQQGFELFKAEVL